METAQSAAKMELNAIKYEAEKESPRESKFKLFLVRSALNRMRSPGLTLLIPLNGTLNGRTESGPLQLGL